MMTEKAMFALIKSTIAKACPVALTVAALSIWAEPAMGGAPVGQVPEPATLLLLAVGLIVLWWGLKKRKP
jgi:hypothetical protein